MTYLGGIKLKRLVYIVVPCLLTLLWWGGCANTTETVRVIEDPFWANIKVILEYGGIPAVILLFGYLYLRSLMKEYGRQLAAMQAQIGKQQEAMNMIMVNNTEALARLGTAMMMGCPLVRNQLTLEAGGTDETKPKGGQGNSG